MKRILMLMLAASMAFGCNESEAERTTPRQRRDIDLTPEQRRMALRGVDFALDFLREAGALDDGNVLVSPLSAQAAFCMAAAGARGETSAEMYRALGMEGAAAAQADDYMKTLIPELLKADNTVKITMANSSWVPDGFLLRAEYAATLRDIYAAEARTLAEDPGEAVAEVNRWCSEHTCGLIDKIVETIPQDTRLVLLDALYFKGRWAEGFDRKASCAGSFRNADGSVSQVTFMNRSFTAEVWSDSRSCAISLPYGNGAFLMTVVMPSSAEESVDDLLESADAAAWKNWCTGSGCYNVELSLPRFKAEYGLGENMIPVMRRLGMQRAFAPGADFSGVCAEPLFIGFADQKTCVDVDEEGTEAAAVTVVGSLVTSAGPKEYDRFVFRVDRPFLYFIREVSTGAVLFAGVQRGLAGQ